MFPYRPPPAGDINFEFVGSFEIEMAAKIGKEQGNPTGKNSASRIGNAKCCIIA
jgi:hypothetical protein